MSIDCSFGYIDRSRSFMFCHMTKWCELLRVNATRIRHTPMFFYSETVFLKFFYKNVCYNRHAKRVFGKKYERANLIQNLLNIL